MSLIKYIITCLLLFSLTASYAQSLTEKTREELKGMQNNAVANENYELADKIKTHLIHLEDNKEKLTELEEKKKKALIIEDYDLVIYLENEINALKSGKPYVKEILSTETQPSNPTAQKIDNSKVDLLCGKKWALVSVKTVMAKNKKLVKSMSKTRPCMADNTLIFNKNQTFIIDEGSDRCNNTLQIIKGRWFWNSSKTAVTLRVSSGKKVFMKAFNKMPERPFLLNESSLIITATLYLGKNPMWDITETYNH